MLDSDGLDSVVDQRHQLGLQFYVLTGKRSREAFSFLSTRALISTTRKDGL
jgi:hypothetical protein